MNNLKKAVKEISDTVHSGELTLEQKIIVLDFTIHKIKMYKEEDNAAFICNIIKEEFDFFDTLEISFPELYNALQKRLKWLKGKDSSYYHMHNPALWSSTRYKERIIFLTKIKEKLLKNNRE